MRSSDKLTGGRVQGSGSVFYPEASASARSPVFFSAKTLEAAIEAATFVRRYPTDDAERVIVFCTALGGSFFYSREEAERRVKLKFSNLVLEDVAAAVQFLEDRMNGFLKPIQQLETRRSNYVNSWRGDY